MSSLVNDIRVPISFDYAVLALENRTVVQQRTKEIRQRLRRAAQDIWEIGQNLVDVRSRLKHGQFEAWLKAEFGWSHRTAYNFINVYEAFGNPAKFAGIDIAASALYLLATPSTPQNIRDQFVQRARAGEKITYKNVRNALKEAKPQLSPAATVTNSLESSIPKLEVVALEPKTNVEVNARALEVEELELRPTFATIISNQSIQPGWYLLEDRHLLLCGDTASPEFFERLPQAAFALAIPSNEWHHDWLINKARTVTILRQSALEEKLLEGLLLMHSRRGEAVIFPWLPSGEIIAVAHKLERQIYAGDSNPERCSEAIAQSGLKGQRVSLC
jgi:hypothetical protein